MTLGEREIKLQSLGYDLSKVIQPKAKYVLLKPARGLLFSSGSIPLDGDQLVFPGKVPSVVSVETATKMAALCTANILRAVCKEYGSLDVIKEVVKLNGYVNSDADFSNQHLVINGASELLHEVFGAVGAHSRTAIGVSMIPLNSCVEVEIIFEMVAS